MAKTQTTSEIAEPKTFSLISDEKLLAIYVAMLKCRLLEQRATELFQHGVLGSDLHASSGREATAAAAVVDLQDADSLCLAPGDWLPSFVKGLSLETVFRALAPSSLQVDGAVEIDAAQKNILPFSDHHDSRKLVRERASACATAKNGQIVMVFLSSDPQSLVAWRATIRASAVKRLPVVFVHYSDPSLGPRNRKHRSVPKPVDALHEGMPSIAVDALDPVAVYRVAYEAIVRARQLRGATLLECVVHPPLSSAPADIARHPVELTLDPVTAMERYIKSKGISLDADRDVVASFHRDLDLATRFLHR
jgi:TPP-dependent pyruvate/acetoin dehydrogenase alpha subunit